MGPVTLIFDLFDLETDTRVVSKVENLPSNWGTLGLWVLELFAMYTTRRTDRQTDGRTKATLIAPLSAFQLRSVRRSLTTEATRALVQAFISCRLDYSTATLFWAGSLMFIFSDSSLCTMRQPAWSPELVATTTSRRFLLAYTGFQYASKSSTRRRCLCGSVYTMQPLASRYLADLCVPAHSVHRRQQLPSTASGTLLAVTPITKSDQIG